MEIPLTAILLSIIIVAIFYYVYRLKNYWKRQGVPTCGNIITGCFLESFKAKENLAVGLEKLYFRIKHQKFVGTYLLGQPLLVLNDPDIIKQVLLTEFPNFASHGIFTSSRYDPISAHLFSLEGNYWKDMRSKMSPSFSSGKIKSMFNIVLNKVQYCEQKISEQESQTVVYNDYMRRLSIDIICACFFGIESNCLGESKSFFRDLSFLLNTPTYGQFLNFILFTHFHKLSDVLMGVKFMRFLPKSADDFLMKLSEELVRLRENNAENRNDFIDTMVQLKNTTDETKAKAREPVTLNTIAAQIFVLFAAGFETTSQTNTYALFEMAKKPEIMKRVQDECDQILRETGGKVTYDALTKMEYTEKVIKETLRLYPALHFLTRSSIKPCKLPTTNVHLEKDTNIWIPLRGIHRNPQYFPDPEKFDPERFSKENQASIPPFVYMPFGDGPRICIGMRFALMSIKTTLMTILSKYNIQLSEETPKQIEFEPLVYFPVPAVNCPLKLVPRNL